jgi:hypothetical protein
MKTKILFLIAMLLILGSCKKESSHKISYMVTNSQSGFTISYSDANGMITTTHVNTLSQQDKKTIYTGYADEGSIVYASVSDTASNSFAQVFIFIDDKVYKQAMRGTNKTMPAMVSGTVPYGE